MSRKVSTSQKWREWKVPYVENGSVPWRMPKADDTHIKERRYYLSDGIKEGDQVFWKPNNPFKAALKFVRMYHGAKESTHAVFMNTETQAKYIMRNEDLAECLLKGVFIHGLILGEWRFRKDGQRLSIVPIEFLSTVELKNNS